MTRATWASTSSRGGRPDNQDDHGEAQAGDARIFVVADGLGGHAAGAQASATAVGAILEAFERDAQPSREAIEAQFGAATDAIHALQRRDPEVAGCRTTAVVLIEHRGSALWGHVGDTRLYHLRGGKVASQTLDHSVPQALVQAGELEPSGIRRHPDRNRLLRALGGDDDGAPTLPGEPLQVVDGDAFLLCTDGFWEWVEETDMEATLAESADAGEWVERMEKLLLDRATGSYDNYTVTAVVLEADEAPLAAVWVLLGVLALAGVAAVAWKLLG